MALRATFAKSVRGGFLRLFSPTAPSPSARSSLVPEICDAASTMAQRLAKAPASSARSGLVAGIGLSDVLSTLPRVLPKAPAVSARSGLAAEIGLGDVLTTMPRVLPKVPSACTRSSLAAEIGLVDALSTMPRVLHKAPVHFLSRAPSGASRSTSWVSRSHSLRNSFTKAQATGAPLPSCMVTKAGLSVAAKAAAAGKDSKDTARKAQATGAPLPSCMLTKAGLSVAAKAAAAGQDTARKIARRGKARANMRLRTAVLVWSIAAGLIAIWYVIKPEPESEDAEKLVLHFDFEAKKFELTEIDSDTMFEIKHIDEPVELEDGMPKSLDWSKRGFLPSIPCMIPMKYNWNSGCCWAIAAVKSVEWAYAIKYGKTFPLSVQQLRLW